MGFDDIVDKAKDAAGDLAGKADELLHSEQAEGVSDSLLDKGADLINKATGGKFEEQVDGVRDGIDAKIGTDEADK